MAQVVSTEMIVIAVIAVMSILSAHKGAVKSLFSLVMQL